MIYVTHDQVEAMTLASRIVVLSAGNIEQVGTPLELYERPENVFVARFIGSPSMNILEGKVFETGARTGVEIEGGDRAHASVPSTQADMGRTVKVGVRPEDLAPTDGESVFHGEVAIVEALGETTLLYFMPKEGAEPIVAKLPGIQHFKRGETVRLGADPDEAARLRREGSLVPLPLRDPANAFSRLRRASRSDNSDFMKN